MRPYIFVNLAMSADGKISTRERRQVKISGADDFKRVDEIKAGADAIMVGIGTVLGDDPSLTVKSPDLKAARRARGEDEHPLRVVVDSMARTPLDADILCKGEGRRIVAVSAAAQAGRVEALREKAEVVVVGEQNTDLTLLMHELAARGVGRLMVEGGGTLIWGLFRAGLVDELITYVGSIVIGGAGAPTPADGEGFAREDEFPRLELAGVERVDDGVLLRWVVKKEVHSAL
ncbi:2,5-diamino-6-(ribosylamino)-4(3H)-pyrimidinone 5'-phosphate reductase [Methanofollis formosanus]|uniref:2,5-diamino-6-(ribosylamino)-4(3H)-pyrimidinone 5'-phosphate reductase n=1 Tax=Methanofollis formosanus TaxID=299308 RepID=A0A8G1EGC1_9EURY|nr:2,5-diamino-6-(ribosylamino)-4(3H)-pyrimidinone 5'-phosphate reductase [Methanofollis formosanus]QYZ78767.1 2,5-diamino-6-(ribosylamino)-4(3H)-pyrimidinone 5'-phosphate reductase [Methanofollis formosanus]